MNPFFTPQKMGYLLLASALFFSRSIYSQCTLNANISGNTSVCNGSTTLTANVTGANNCTGTETLGLFYSLDDCKNPGQTGYQGAFPATVAPASSTACQVNLDPYNMFYGTNQTYSCNASFGGTGAETSTTGMCTEGYNGNSFCGDVLVSNNCAAGFFLRITASSAQPAQLSKLSFYVKGVTQLSSVACTKLGVRITAGGSQSPGLYYIDAIAIPRTTWTQYTLDLSSVPALTINSILNTFDIFFQGYAPEGPLSDGQTAPMFEMDQIRVYYKCESSSSTPSYSWTGPNGFTSSQQSITATTAGTYYVTVTDCQGCTVTKSVVVTGCTNCSISSVSATPSACNSATNTYSTTGWIDFTNPPSIGTLTINDGAISQTFNAPFTSPIFYTLSGISSNGSTHTVTASFSAASCSNTTTYPAPQSCTVQTCSISSVSAVPGACNSGTNTYSVSGTVYFSNPPSTGTLTVSDGIASQMFYAPFTVPLSYTLTGIPASGSTHTVTASFSDVNCTKSTAYTAPQNCGAISCTVTLTAIPSSCNSADNSYTVTGRATIVNAPGGSIITFTDGTTSQSYTIPNSQVSTTWVDYTLTGFTANSSNHTVYATVSSGASCQGSITYTAPANCLCTNPTPSVNNPTICTGNSATLTVTSCAGSISWNDGTTGATKTVSPTATTAFTATCTAGSCSGTATATVTVVNKPVPTIDVTSSTICEGGTSTLTVSGCIGTTLTWNDNAGGVNKTVSPTATTTYTVTCTTYGGCSGTATATVIVTPKPAPSVNSPSICAGNSATLTVSNCASSISWNDGTTGATKTVSPASTTTYTATCSVGSCSGTTTGTVTVSTATTPTPSVNNPSICAGSSATLTVSNCNGSISWNDGTTGATKTVSPSSTTAYTATCTVSSGSCSGTGNATATVTVTPKPTPSVNSPSICAGSSATLTVSNCNGSVSWNDGTTGATKTVSPTSTTTYTATCSVGSCSGVATGTVTVPTVATPTPTVNSPSICTRSSATLTVSNCAGSISWNDGTTGAVKTVSPTATSTYTATCTVSSGSCSGTGNATATVTVTPKPTPTPTVNNVTICTGGTATLTVSNCNGTVSWNTGSTAASITVNPTATTSYTVTCSEGTAPCNGTATATGTVTVSTVATPTPTVNSPSICTGSSATLTVSNCAGSISWNDGTTGAVKTVSPTATTTYTASCTVSSGSCSGTGTATATVTVTPKPTISINATGISCATDLTTYSITFTATAGATVTADKGIVSGNTVTGIASGQTVTLTATANGCTATASATKSCNCPTINPPIGTNTEICEGDPAPVLRATVDPGLQADWYNAASSGTKVASGLSYTPAIAQYPAGGDFYVEAVNPTSGCKSPTRTKVSWLIHPKPTLSTQTACNANNLSYSVTVTTNAASITADKGTVSGLTVTGIPTGQTVTITATSDKDCKTTKTLTQDCAAPCTLPTFKVTTASVCVANSWSIGITVSQTGMIKVNKGTVSGSGTNFTVSNIPAGTALIITDSLSSVCKKDTVIAPPKDCNCVTEPPIAANTTVCKGTAYPMLHAIIVGYGTVDWYKKAAGGTPLATATLSYQPTGVVAANDTFYLQARNLAVGTCPDPDLRTKVVVYAQTCTDTVDLALKKSINTKIAQTGDELTYTLKVWNESNKNATGVSVTDSIAKTAQFVAGSFTASRGNATISGNVIQWTIGNVAAAGVPANGDTVTLTYQVKATQEGVHFNTAEICTTLEKDVDSTPCNHKGDEDDMDTKCFTVPFKLCPANKVEVNVPAQYTNVQWFKNGGSTPIASGNAVLLSEVGTYTFTAMNQTCPVDGCCPIIIEAGINCCPEDLCIPFTIQKSK
ncbi:hypothetical protein FHS57_006294 [Runella defluvii]|uniref:DUF11 domain-containing protein n=1 Tax=Runella defluvii TaxID=370973 RepID=A0A7W6ETZ2_9BACT|nr:DUF11 domain-containing protein [Runella defluvii]MBB3842263.1 hypothetical protein [Runella defluvii]